VFLLRHIWKKAPRRSLLAVVFALGLSLVSQPALALGETFTWANADETSITATGGNFGTATATFAKTGDVSGGATFSGATTYTCAGQSKTGQLTITVDAQNYKKVYPTAGAITGADDSCGFLSAFISKANVNPETGQATSAAPSANECDQGSLTWLACPVIDNVAGTISKLAQGVLEPFLQVKPISADTTPQLYAAWSHIRDLAEVLFILVFFVMIGANMLQQDIGGVDQYTVKKTLPRLVVAAILVQFSFLISSLIVDIGNILGGGVSTLLISITNPSEGPASIFNVFQNLIVGSLAAVVGAGAIAVLASWTVAIPLLLSLLMSILVVFLTLGARYLLIAVLVVVSPLALVAWALPHTEKHFKTWMNLLTNLVMMYPIVMGIISLAGILNEILPFSSDTAPNGAAAVAAGIIKPIIVLAAFMIVPASFRWANAGLHRIHGLLSNGAERGKTALKGSDMWERGLQERQGRKNMFMNRVLNSDAITSLQGKGKGGQAVAGMMAGGAALALMRAPTDRAALQRSNSALINKTSKQLDDLKEAQNPNNLKLALAASVGDDDARNKLQQSAPELLRYTKTAQGREAIFKRLTSTEFTDSKDLDQFRTIQPKRGLGYFGANGDLSAEYSALRDTGQAKRNQLPTVMQRFPAAKASYDVTDRGGNVVTTLTNRGVGSVDVNGVSKSFAKYTAGDYGKISTDVFGMMQSAKTARAGSHEHTAAVDAALAMAIGAAPGELSKAFDVKGRHTADIERRIAIAKAMQATSTDIWKTNDEYKQTFHSVINHIQEDDKISIQLARSAGVTEQELRTLSPTAVKWVASRWMQNRDFNYHTTGLTSAAANVEANRWEAAGRPEIPR